MSRSEELELQFSPSRWSRRYRAEEIVQKHVEFITKASNAAKKHIPCQLDVPYGSTEAEKLDIFGTNLPEDAPIFIYIHGGGYWQELSREISSYVVEPLYKSEFKVIILGYTLYPQGTLAQIIEQIQKAFIKCLEYANSNGSRALYICGHSTGAHLVATLFQSCFSSLSQDQTLLKGVFLISGVYDLLPLTKTFVNDTLKLDTAAARKFSPLYQNIGVSPAVQNIEFFVIVGENDTPKYIEQSETFNRKLNSIGCKSEFIVVNEVDHYDIAEHMNEDNYEIVRLIISLEDY